VNGIGSESCLMLGFDIIGTESLHQDNNEFKLYSIGLKSNFKWHFQYFTITVASVY